MSATVNVPSDWTSGYYLADVLLTDGPHAGNLSYAPFIIRAGPSRPSPMLFVAATNTWQAYNNWGGKSLYAYNSAGGVPATHVSFDRPFGPGAQNLFGWEYQLVRFLESRGYDVSYTIDVDIDAHPQELLRHRLVIVAGHSEYWTKVMRDGFETARQRGTNLAFVGANIGYTQIRYADSQRTIVAYRSATLDPEPDPSLKTVNFRSLNPPRPECELLGVQYNSASGRAKLTDYGINAASLSDPWFQGTGLTATSTLRGLVGYEWDAVQPHCVTPPLAVLFHTSGPPDADAVRYVASSGARVFSTGSLQFTWGLDDWGVPGHADPRLQRFMVNALRDLRRPAPPRALAVGRAGGGARLRATLHQDPRIIGVRIFMHAGAGAFVPTRPIAMCKARGTSCVLRLKVRAGTYRFAAEAFDRWSSSAPILSRPVRVQRGAKRAERTGRP